MRIVEKPFISIQGEGQLMNTPTLFVRTAGCNLAEKGIPCNYCDTSYSWYLKDGKEVETDKLLKDIDLIMIKQCLRHVCLTGGEPLFQPDAVQVIKHLSRAHLLSVETNGSLPIWHTKAMWSMDIKCPSAGNHEEALFENIAKLKPTDQLKFVISDRNDFDYAVSVVRKWGTHCLVFFQPAWKTLPPQLLVEWLLADKVTRSVSNIRLGMQSHKIIWPHRKRGV